VDVPTVQRRARAVGSTVLTLAAVLLVVVALTTPSRLEDMTPTAFVRLPAELLVLLAVVLAVPDRMARARALVVLAAGAVLAVVAVFRLLDVGFLQALNRPFDPMIDWRYAGSLLETVRGSAQGSLGVLLLVGAAGALVATLVLVPLAVVRIVHVAERHRSATTRVVAVLVPVWLALSLLGVRAGTVPLASGATASYAYAHVARIPSQLRDQREFALAAAADPQHDVRTEDLLTGLRGKDVLLVFVESYGRVALEDPELSGGVVDVLDAGTGDLRSAGVEARSAYLTSPTFGALSWLAHSTLQSGLWIDSQQRYDQLVTTRRETLSSLFARAGWRTVAAVPANNRDWPQGEFYRFDHVYDSRNIGYHGPRFGYPTMPDQFTLDAVRRLELAPNRRRPVMAEIDLISSHAPWSRTPRTVAADELGDGSVFDGMPDTLPSESEIWPDPQRVRAAYADAVEYSLRSVVSFVTAHVDDDLVVVVLGDHQPASIVSGSDPGHDVPVSVISGDPAVTERISAWGWDVGLRPTPEAPVWRMDGFRDRFLTAFGPGDTGTPR
jgi:hypothetical protein